MEQKLDHGYKKDLSGPLVGTRRCPCCDGTGEVSGVVDDVQFVFQCPCSGGSEEATRWLLGKDPLDLGSRDQLRRLRPLPP